MFLNKQTTLTIVSYLCCASVHAQGQQPAVGTAPGAVPGAAPGGTGTAMQGIRILTPNDGRTHVKGKPDNSLWVRYLLAGEDAKAKKDDALAKRYWLAGIAEFQKHPPKVPTDRRERGNMLVRLSNLEKHLRESFPSDWSKFEGSQQEQLNLRKEQADLYNQFARINAAMVSSNNLFASKAMERAVIADRDYKQALQAAGAGTGKTATK